MENMNSSKQEKLERRVKKILDKRRSELPEGLRPGGRGPGMGRRGVYTGPQFYYDGKNIHLPPGNLWKIASQDDSALMKILNRTHYEALRQVEEWDRKIDKTFDDAYYVLREIKLTPNEQARCIEYWDGINLHEVTKERYIPDYEKDFFRTIYSRSYRIRIESITQNPAWEKMNLFERFITTDFVPTIPPILDNSVWDHMTSLERWKIKVNKLRENYLRNKKRK